MNKIKYYREVDGITLEQLALRTKNKENDGLSVGYLSHLENGSRQNPSIETMKRIAKALEKTVAEVFFPEDK